MENEFLRNVKNHGMEILMDQGVYRHIRFGKLASKVFCFELITWPGFLTICGDMGTYTFERTEDMFEFFSYPEQTDLSINPFYWAGKLQSICKLGGYQSFSPELCKREIESHMIECWIPEYENEEQRQRIEKLVEEEIFDYLGDEPEAVIIERIYNFSEEGFELGCDFLIDRHLMEHNYHYIWCCYAIVWGIQQYYKETKNV